MRSAYRITPKLVVALIIAGVTLIGSVSRSTRAQEGAKPGQPLGPPDNTVKPAPDPGPLDVPPSVEVPTLPPNAPAELVPAAANPGGPENADPEKSARAFVEQNRKVAQGELKSLKDEAERLRTRLGKVEAGIRRWEALVAALDQSEKTLVPGTVPSTLQEPEKGARLIGVSKK
jgi:hypothetical protein